MKYLTVILAASSFGLSTAMASAGSGRSSFEQLPLIIEDVSQPQGMRQLGSLGRTMSALRKAKHTCDLSTYAYGGNVTCNTRHGQMVYIGITAEPTRDPEFAIVEDIRPDGVNSAYLPKSEFAAFLADLMKREPAH